MARRGENIRKRKDGRWEGRYYVYDTKSNKKIIRSVYARTYADVKEKLLIAKLSAEDKRIEKNMNAKIKFRKVALEWLCIVSKSKKHATYIKYKSVYEKHIGRSLDMLFLSELNEFILTDIFSNNKEQGLSESMKRTVACVLNQILLHAELHYHIQCFKCTYQKQHSKERTVVVLNQTEQAKLLHYLYDETDIYKIGIIICISTGLRLGEICSLKWTDIDLKRKVLYVNSTVQRIAVDGERSRTVLLEGEPKSIFSKREIPLSEDIVKLLTPYYNVSVKYVINSNKPVEPRTYQYKFQKYLKIAGVEKKNFHVLRHTFATNCIDNGTDVKSLSEILGHSDVKITLNRYVHPAFEVKRQHMNSLSAVYGQLMGQSDI